MAYCHECRTFHYDPDKHFPTWETNVIWWPGHKCKDDDWRPFRAMDAEDAARRAAEEYDSEDYPLLKGATVKVEVRLRSNIAEIFRFNCHAESLPHYYADEIKEPE